MENRYRVYVRENGIYYVEDVVTKQQESLRTRDKKKALALLVARNQAVAQPALNVTMAKAYLSGRSPELSTRNWNDVFEEMMLGYDGSTKKRFSSFIKSAPVQPLKRVPLIETDASHFLNTMRHPRAGTRKGDLLPSAMPGSGSGLLTWSLLSHPSIRSIVCRSCNGWRSPITPDDLS